MPRRPHQDQGLFPCEAEVARRLSQDPVAWKAKAIILEREGLPRIDPVFGARPWIAIEAWLKQRYGLSHVGTAFALDGKENLDAL